MFEAAQDSYQASKARRRIRITGRRVAAIFGRLGFARMTGLGRNRPAALWSQQRTTCSRRG